MGGCPNRSGQIPFVSPNPLPSGIQHEVSGSDILIHINYAESLITGGSPTLTKWTTTGLSTGGNPDSIDVLANEIKLTYLTDSVTGEVKVSQTAIDDAAKTTEGIHVGVFTEIVASPV